MTTIQIPEMDFARALADIIASGLTPADVARILNVHRNTLDHWRNGARPRWHEGTAILILHDQRVKKLKSTPSSGNT